MPFWSFLSFLGAFDSHNYSQSALGIQPRLACSIFLVVLTVRLLCHPNEARKSRGTLHSSLYNNKSQCPHFLQLTVRVCPLSFRSSSCTFSPFFTLSFFRNSSLIAFDLFLFVLKYLIRLRCCR